VANLFDTTNAPTGVPTELVVGDLFQFKITEFSQDYSNSLHTMRFIARIATGTNTEILVTATADGDDYLFSAASSVTANYEVGHYHYQLEIEQDSTNNRIIVDRGEIDILTDFDNNVDPRYHAEIVLDKIEAMLSGKADADVSSYSIEGRSLSKFSFAELLDARDRYRREVAAHKREEAIKHGKKTKASILMRF
jgi:hypothetical protein